jgi:hypothetical protein
MFFNNPFSLDRLRLCFLSLLPLAVQLNDVTLATFVVGRIRQSQGRRCGIDS